MVIYPHLNLMVSYLHAVMVSSKNNNAVIKLNTCGYG